MKIIAGLGNPGREYEKTPHNVGFEAVSLLASRFEVDLRSVERFRSLVAMAQYRGERVALMQPQTFMNSSGLAVSALMRYYKVPPTDLVVVYDDADLPPGRLRVRPGGSSGGHKGMTSIEEQLGVNSFARVRIGVGRGRGSLVSHVLGGLGELDRQRVERVVKVAADAALSVLAEGTQRAMDRYNGWSVEKEEEERQARASTEGQETEGLSERGKTDVEKV